MTVIKKIALLLSIVLVVGACAGLIVHKTAEGSQSVVKRPASEVGSSSVDVGNGVEPEGIYLYVTQYPVCGFSLEIDGATVIQDMNVSGISGLVGDYYATTASYDEGCVYLLPFEGVKLTIGGAKHAEEDPSKSGDLKGGAQKAGYANLRCWVFYFDGTFDTYSAKENDTPVEISLSDNVQFVCVINEDK